MIKYTINRIVDNIFSEVSKEFALSKLKSGINDYISNEYRKFRLTKNILFRNEPVDFYDNYLPLTLKSNKEVIKILNVKLIEKNDKIIILGNAGSGKTTLLIFIALICIEENTGLIPVYVPLRNFKEQDFAFDDFVANLISDANQSEIKDLFKSGKFLFLLDGFDEINYSEGASVINQIQKFIFKYDHNKFIISSRQGTNIESLTQFHVYQILPLNKNDISIYIERLQLSNIKKELFYESVDEDIYFYQYLTTPLFLSIYINFILNHNDLTVPRRKSIFFRNLIDTLFSKHDSVSKLGFIRNKLSGLNKDELERVSIILAFRYLIASRSSFSKDELIRELELIKRSKNLVFENDKLIYDLTITLNVLVIEGDYFNFPHILLQEYLSSLFISQLRISEKTLFYTTILAGDKLNISPSLLTFLFELDNQHFLKDFLIPNLENENSLYVNSRISIALKDFLRNNFKIGYEYFERENLINTLKSKVNYGDISDLGELFSF